MGRLFCDILLIFTVKLGELSVLTHIFFHILAALFLILFSIKFEVSLVFLSPFRRFEPAGFFPGDAIGRIGLLRAPLLHILELTLMLTFRRQAYRLVRSMNGGLKRLSAYTTSLFFRHIGLF